MIATTSEMIIGKIEISSVLCVFLKNEKSTNNNETAGATNNASDKKRLICRYSFGRIIAINRCPKLETIVAIRATMMHFLIANNK